MGCRHFLIYWDALFDTHNEWLEEPSAAKRRRYAAGARKNDPEKAKAPQRADSGS